MRKSGATKDYKFGQKNHWRRTIWNEILRRTDGKEQAEPILYLAGPEDLDRAVLLDKGVPVQNLIAIDRSSDNVDTIRRKGFAAVNGDVLDILWSWPEDRPVCAVLLDFCSGIIHNNLGIYDVFERKPLRNATVAINFMRGRDAESNDVRELLKNAGLLNPIWKTPIDGSEEPQMVFSDTKHRGYQFVLYHALDTWASSTGGGSGNQDQEGRAKFRFPLPAETQEYALFNWMIAMLADSMRPKFLSYRSGVLVFDSVVFNHPRGQLMDRYVPELQDMFDRSVRRRFEKFRERPLVRKIAAMLAVRTMRTRGRI